MAETDAAMSRYWERAYFVFRDAERFRNAPGGRDSLLVEPQIKHAFDFALLRVERRFAVQDTAIAACCAQARFAKMNTIRLLNWSHLSQGGDVAATERAAALEKLLQAIQHLTALLEDRLYHQIESEIL